MTWKWKRKTFWNHFDARFLSSLLRSLTYIQGARNPNSFFFHFMSYLQTTRCTLYCTWHPYWGSSWQCHNVSPSVRLCASLLCLGPGSGIVRGSLNYLWYISIAKISCIRVGLDIPLISLPRMMCAAPQAGGGRARPAISPPRTRWPGTRLKRSFQITN